MGFMPLGPPSYPDAGRQIRIMIKGAAVQSRKIFRGQGRRGQTTKDGRTDRYFLGNIVLCILVNQITIKTLVMFINWTLVFKVFKKVHLFGNYQKKYSLILGIFLYFNGWLSPNFSLLNYQIFSSKIYNRFI